MADYKDILSGTLGRLADKVKEAADSSGVLDVYAQGTNRAKAFGQTAKLTLELNGEHEELKRVYTEIGRVYFEQARQNPEGIFVPLFEQAERIMGDIREKRARIEELKATFSPDEQSAIDAEIGNFDDVVSATEADGMTADTKE